MYLAHRWRSILHFFFKRKNYTEKVNRSCTHREKLMPIQLGVLTSAGWRCRAWRHDRQNVWKHGSILGSRPLYGLWHTAHSLLLLTVTFECSSVVIVIQLLGLPPNLTVVNVAHKDSKCCREQEQVCLVVWYHDVIVDQREIRLTCVHVQVKDWISLLSVLWRLGFSQLTKCYCWVEHDECTLINSVQNTTFASTE